MTPQVPRAVVNRRSAGLARRVRQIALDRNRAWEGWRGEVLVDEVGRSGSVVGRNVAYKPVVVKGREVGGLMGRVVAVQVVEAFQSHLRGAVL
jgi:tRNA A37 methylthiotransferase MiaB